MVYIHGGNLVAGSASDAHVEPLVREGGIVAVAVNYRLNVFGFFAAPGSGSSSNFGIQDLIAALHWVQTNIASFGGDPSRVTIWGQSAGARAVMVLYQSPLARGLFHRAIAQSPGLLMADFTRPVASAAETMGQRCLDATSCDSIACLRELPSAALAGACHFYLTPSEFLPVAGQYLAGYDGEVVRSPILSPFCSGAEAASADAPLLLGSLVHEWRLFERFSPGLGSAAMVGRLLEELLPSYGRGGEGLRRCALSRLLGPYAGATCDAAEASECPTLGDPALLRLATDLYSAGLLAGAGPGSGGRYRYLLDVEAQRSGLGSAHGADLCYLFSERPWEAGALCGDGSPNPEQGRLGRMLREYWASFAETGEPRSALGPRWVPASAGGARRSAGLPMLSVRLGGKIAMSSARELGGDAAFAVLADLQCGRLDVRRNGTGCYFERRGSP